VTQEKQRAPLRSTREDLFELVESATDFAIFTIDPNGIVTTWNTGAERLFGFAAEEIVGSAADVIFTLEDRQAGAPQKERRVAREKGRAQDERWHQRKDGTQFWASGLMMPLKGEEGFFKITRDRTEQHEAYQRLRENEERFRILATSIPQLVFRTRPGGERTWGSPQWTDFTGLGLDESVGFGWLDAVHPEDRGETQAAWRDAREKKEYYVEHRLRRQKDGEYRWQQTRAKPINPQLADTSDWVGTTTDIHDIRGLRDRQQVLVAELQHRTRNLLAVVQAIANQTIRSSGSLEDFRNEFADRLRALSRVQALLAHIEDEGIDLRKIVESELVAHGSDSLERGKVRVSGSSLILRASAAQALSLALHELATNALNMELWLNPTDAYG